MKYTVLKNTVIHGQICEAGQPVDITDSEYAKSLLADGNISEGGEAAPRTAPEETTPPAASEAPATGTPLEPAEQPDSPDPSQVQQDALLEGSKPERASQPDTPTIS